MRPQVIIVGGGLAGLAAASALAEHGVSVTLLESRPRLGGRASSFIDRATDTPIDNCQHVSMGCCTNFQNFCHRVGILDLLSWHRQLNFVDPDGKIHCLKASPLPAPTHLMPSFWKLSYLSGRDKFGIAKVLGKLARYKPATTNRQSFLDWLHHQKQTRPAIEWFWKVVLVSALSESLDRIGVAQARKVFVDAFLKCRDGWSLQIPTVPLDELYGQRVIRWLNNRHATVRLQTGVERVEIENNVAIAVLLRNGQRLSADHFIVAVPHQLVPSLLPASLYDHPQLAVLNRLESAPISSVHLWFDREVTDLPHAVFVEGLSQWIFNRNRLLSNSDSRQFYYQVVISASRHVADQSRQRTIDEVVRELSRVWPQVAEAELIHSRLVTEHRAVFSVTPDSDSFRPVQQSPVGNLQLAGDWTQTGWPATMEGAVRSGYLAAENTLNHLCRPATIVQADKPAALLSKIAFGL